MGCQDGLRRLHKQASLTHFQVLWIPSIIRRASEREGPLSEGGETGPTGGLKVWFDVMQGSLLVTLFKLVKNSSFIPQNKIVLDQKSL